MALDEATIDADKLTGQHACGVGEKKRRDRAQLRQLDDSLLYILSANRVASAAVVFIMAPKTFQSTYR